jgi:tetratricopeptide (TPR) repeat protein
MASPDKRIYRKIPVRNFAKATTDRDREADVELNRPYIPSRDLLKARYLIQGGYYAEADSLLNRINQGEFSIDGYRNEYYLLMAKVEFNTKRISEALLNCDMAISQGRRCEEHYAAEAALLAGDILLTTGKKDKATDYFKMALEIKGQNDVYIEIIENMARNRLNNI